MLYLEGIFVMRMVPSGVVDQAHCLAMQAKLPGYLRFHQPLIGVGVAQAIEQGNSCAINAGLSLAFNYSTDLLEEAINYSKKGVFFAN